MDRQFLSIRETSKDELIVTIPAQDNFEHPIRGDVKLKEVRWTLHTSQASIEGGETFNCHFVLEDGTRIQSSAFHLSKMSNGYFPFFAQRVPILSDPRFAIPPRPRDRIINLGAFEQQYASLVFALTASCHGADALGEAPGFQVCMVPFRHWDLHVAWSYMLIPSMPNSDMAVAATSSLTENRIPVVNIPPRKRHMGRTQTDTWQDLHTFVRLIVERTQRRLIAIGVDAEADLRLAASFSRHPLVA